MTKAFIALALALLTSSFLFGIYSYQNTSKIASLEKSKERGKLSWYAEMAKAKGHQEIAFRAPIESYAVPKSLDEALAHHYLMVIQPIEQKSYASHESIRTWYKFKIIEELSAPTRYCTNCPGIESAPPEFLPLQTNEILASQSGGEVEIDGIRLISKDPDFPAFEKGKRYLVFLSLDSQKGVGAIQMGPWGTFGINEQEQLKTINEKLQHPVRDELTDAYHNSLGRLRSQLKSTRN